MSENWKPVLGYEGHYEISDYARDKAEGKYGISNRDKTHCKNGHEFSPENTSFEREGKKRVCRTCRRDRERARRVATKSKI